MLISRMKNQLLKKFRLGFMKSTLFYVRLQNVVGKSDALDFVADFQTKHHIDFLRLQDVHMKCLNGKYNFLPWN